MRKIFEISSEMTSGMVNYSMMVSQRESDNIPPTNFKEYCDLIHI